MSCCGELEIALIGWRTRFNTVECILRLADLGTSEALIEATRLYGLGSCETFLSSAMSLGLSGSQARPQSEQLYLDSVWCSCYDC